MRSIAAVAVVSCLLALDAFGAGLSVPLTFTTGSSDPGNGLINAGSTPVTFVNLGGLGFDLRIDAGETQSLAPLGDVHVLDATVPVVNFSFFATGTLNPISVLGVAFRIEDVEAPSEALTGFSYADVNGIVQSPLFSDTSIFTPDAGTIIDLGGSRFYHPVAQQFVQLGKGIGVDLASTPLQSFTISKAAVSGAGGVTIGPSLGSITPIPEPVGLQLVSIGLLAWGIAKGRGRTARPD